MTSQSYSKRNECSCLIKGIRKKVTITPKWKQFKYLSIVECITNQDFCVIGYCRVMKTTPFCHLQLQHCQLQQNPKSSGVCSRNNSESHQSRVSQIVFPRTSEGIQKFQQSIQLGNSRLSKVQNISQALIYFCALQTSTEA